MSTSGARSKRNRSVLTAVGASLLSKGGSSLLQFVSMPVAARVLGREEFGIYATVFVSLYMLEVLQIGVGPALARGIAAAAAESDRKQERRLYLTGAVLVVALAVGGFLLGALVITFVPVAVLFGEAYETWRPVLIPALWTGLALLAADLVARHTDRVREGYMEASIAIAWVAAGNVLGAIAVVVGVYFFPSPTTILLAVFLPNILVRLANTVFLLKKRPWLILPLELPKRRELTAMLNDGVLFAATSTIVYLVEFRLSGLLVGHILGPSAVALHFVLTMIITAFAGMLIMVGNPLWAAIVDAKTKGDHEWLKEAARRYYQYLAFLTLVAAIGLIGFGPWLIPSLFGPDFETGRLLLSAHAVLLFALGWRRVNRYVAIGLGLLSKTVAPILTGMVFSLVFGAIGLEQFGLPGLYLGLAIGVLVIPGAILPRIVRDELDRADNKERPAAIVSETDPIESQRNLAAPPGQS